MKILVLPDIHGRTFWKTPCENIEKYDKVIFLGDYLDPYDFEKIAVYDAIDNFKDILLFAEKHHDKVITLLGNHDGSYFSSIYYGFSTYHCRHSNVHHKEISEIFKSHEDFFKVAEECGGILFTHAGCTSGWLNEVFKGKYDKEINMDDLCQDLNNLLKSKDGLLSLYMISSNRGGYDDFGSCIWADYYEMLWDSTNSIVDGKHHPIHDIKQVFGHTMQAFRENPRIIEKSEGRFELVSGYKFGNALETKNIKMVDTACAYELDTEKFEINKIENS